MKKIEKEIKYQIAHNSYMMLNEYFVREAIVLSEMTHENFYIDNINYEIENSGGSARIRIKSNGAAEFTVKKRINNCQDILHIKDEYTKALGFDSIQNINRGVVDFELTQIIKEFFKINSTTPFIIIGSMNTTRKKFLIKDEYSPKGLNYY